MQGVHSSLFEHLKTLSKRDLMRYVSSMHERTSVFMGGVFYALSYFDSQEKGEIDDEPGMIANIKLAMKATAIEYYKLDPELFNVNVKELGIDPAWILDVEEEVRVSNAESDE